MTVEEALSLRLSSAEEEVLATESDGSTAPPSDFRPCCCEDDGSGIILTSFTNPSLSSLDASAITRFAVGDGGDVAAEAAASSIGEEAVGIEDVSSQEFSEEALSVGGEESAPFGEREPRRPALLWNGAVVDVKVGEEEAEATGDADADVVIIGGGGAAVKAPPRDSSDSTPKARRGSVCSGAEEAMAAVVGKEGRWAGNGSTPLTTTTPSPLAFGERREK